LEESGEKSNKALLKLAKLPRLYRLLRILRLFKMMRLFKYSRSIKKIQNTLKVNSGVEKMITVAITMFFIVHLISCFWFLTSSFQDFNPWTWVGSYGFADYDVGS
jgi:hyperpolarization activated cyclic nucleotide-gated potassium channel 2